MKSHLNPARRCAVRHFIEQYEKSIFSNLADPSTYFPLHQRQSHVGNAFSGTISYLGLHCNSLYGLVIVIWSINYSAKFGLQRISSKTVL